MITTREQWLNKLTSDHLTDLFAKAGVTIKLDSIRLSCGWPSSRPFAGKNGLRSLGECWSSSASKDAKREIFVSPVLADGVEVAAVLIHELVHACLPDGTGHGKEFKELATGAGLTGKMTATVASDWLKCWLAKAIAEVGPYPHATLDMSKRKKQTTRLLKVHCLNDGCDFFAEEEKRYTVRMSSAVFDAGAPLCGSCREPMQVCLKGEK